MAENRSSTLTYSLLTRLYLPYRIYKKMIMPAEGSNVLQGCRVEIDILAYRDSFSCVQYVSLFVLSLLVCYSSTSPLALCACLPWWWQLAEYNTIHADNHRAVETRFEFCFLWFRSELEGCCLKIVPHQAKTHSYKHNKKLGRQETARIDKIRKCTM